MDSKLDEVISQISALKGDTEQVRTALTEFGGNVEDFFDALEDMASYVLALEGIVKTVIKAVPVDVNDVIATISERRNGEEGGDVGRAEHIAQYIVTGKLPE